MDTYDRALEVWQSEPRHNEGSFYLFIYNIIDQFPYVKYWDIDTFDEALRIYKRQEPKYYEDVLCYSPPSWTPDCEDKFLSVYFSMRDAGTEFGDMIRTIKWYAFPSNSLSLVGVRQADYTRLMLRYLDKYLNSRATTVDSTVVPDQWKEN